MTQCILYVFSFNIYYTKNEMTASFSNNFYLYVNIY